MDRSRNNFHVHIGPPALEAQEAVDFVTSDKSGGIAVFAGTTRRLTDNRETIELYYEAYEEMAMRAFEKLAVDALERWPLCKVYLAHRLGRVPYGEASVLIAVSAPHRGEAFEACRWLIDRVKTQVPIWKKEMFADGGQEWVEGTLPEA